MADRIVGNQRRLSELFAGDDPGPLVTISPAWGAGPAAGDCLFSDASRADWLDCLERRWAESMRWHLATGDDSVPYQPINTGTEVFAAAFGCPVKVYPHDPPAAMPLVTTAAEADALPTPRLDGPVLGELFEIAAALRRRLGPEAILGVPDIQSPFDIAALIWRKQDLLLALYDSPDAVRRLTARCQALLAEFLEAFIAEFAPVNLCHCPYAWAPPELGLWLSEDEAGALSTAMFEQFCAPPLAELSDRFGGLFMHCCASADHQYANFARLPRLRGVNRVFQEPHPGAQPAIDRFAGRTVLIMAWITEQRALDLLSWSRPGSRWLFNLAAPTIDEARAVIERIRAAT